MAIAGVTHEISMQKDVSSTEYGYMLARDQGGRPLWRSTDATTLNPGYYTSSATYANQPPEIELAIAQDEWHSSFGLQDTERGAEKRYRTSYGADLRQKGRVYNGPASATLTLPTNFIPSLGNPGFELNNESGSLLFWIKESGTGGWTRVNSPVQAGSYSGQSSGGDGTTTNIYGDIPDYALFKSITLTFTCYVHQSIASQAKIRIDDGVGTTDSSTDATTGSWVQLSVQRAIAANATKLRFYLIDTVNNGACRFDTAAVTRDSGTTSTTGNYVRFIDYNSALYLARGTSLLKYTGSGNWTYVGGFGAAISDMAVLGAKMFVAAGGGQMWYSENSDDSNWTQATTANNSAQFFTEISGTLWYKDGAATIRNITSANGTASAQTTVGITTTSITGLIRHQGLLYIMKTDQPYERDASGTIVSIMPDAVSETSSTSGKNPAVFQGDLYMQSGSQSLRRWTSSTSIENISPAIWAVAEADFGGKVLALAADAQYLFAVIQNGTKIEVLSGRKEVIAGESDWRWHPIAELTFSACNHAWTSSVGSDRLWLCGDSADTPTFYYRPAKYSDPVTDTTYNRNTSGTFYTSWYSGGFIDVNKSFFSVSILGDNLSANKTVTIAYQFPGDSDWSRVLTVFDAEETQFFPASSVAKKIRFKLTLASDSATAGPVLRGLIVRASLMPTKLRRFEFTVRVSDNVQDMNGTLSTVAESTLTSELKTLNAATWPIMLRDLDNTLYYVKFQQCEEIPVLREPNENYERLFNIVATECKVS